MAPVVVQFAAAPEPISEVREVPLFITNGFSTNALRGTWFGLRLSGAILPDGDFVIEDTDVEVEEVTTSREAVVG
jgi:hypothetical protein